MAVGLGRVAKTGVVTISATSANGYSLEDPSWGGGLFTYCLINGLKGSANRNQDEWVTIKEIDNYLEKQIPALSNGAQHPKIVSTLPVDITPLSKVK